MNGPYCGRARYGTGQGRKSVASDKKAQPRDCFAAGISDCETARQFLPKLRRRTNVAKNILRAELSTRVEGASTGTPRLRCLGLQTGGVVTRQAGGTMFMHAQYRGFCG